MRTIKDEIRRILGVGYGTSDWNLRKGDAPALHLERTLGVCQGAGL